MLEQKKITFIFFTLIQIPIPCLLLFHAVNLNRIVQTLNINFMHFINKTVDHVIIPGLEITAAWMPVKMTGQTKFSSDIPRFCPVKL